MNCKTCKFFKKKRGIPFGDCSNDELFQYAETNEDLADIGDNTLVIFGEGVPVVGVNYKCRNYVSRNQKKEKTLSETEDFKNRDRGYIPPAQKKRRPGMGGYEARYRLQFIEPPPNPAEMYYADEDGPPEEGELEF